MSKRRQQEKVRSLSSKIPHMAGGSIDTKKDDAKPEQPSELLQKELGMTPEEIAKMAEGFKAGVEEAAKDQDSVILTDINTGTKYRADKDALLVKSVETKAKDWIVKNKVVDMNVQETGRSLASFRKDLSDEEFEIERKERLFRKILNEMGRRNVSDKNDDNTNSEPVTKLAAATFEEHCKLKPEIQELINAKFKNEADRQEVMSEIETHIYSRILKSGRIQDPDVIANMNTYLIASLKGDKETIVKTLKSDTTGVCTLFHNMYMLQSIDVFNRYLSDIYSSLIGFHKIKTWRDIVGKSA